MPTLMRLRPLLVRPPLDRIPHRSRHGLKRLDTRGITFVRCVCVWIDDLCLAVELLAGGAFIAARDEKVGG